MPLGGGKFYLEKTWRSVATGTQTFNASSNYNIPYGKYYITVEGKGSDGTPAIPGNANYNPIVPGTANYNPVVPGNANYNPVVPGTSNYNPVVPGTSNYNPVVPGTSNYNPVVPASGGNYASTNPSSGGNYASTNPATGGNYATTNPGYYFSDPKYGTSYTPGNANYNPIVPGTSNYNPVVPGTSNYNPVVPASGGNYASTNPATGGNYASTNPATGGNYATTNPATGGNYATTNPATGGTFASNNPATGGTFASNNPTTPAAAGSPSSALGVTLPGGGPGAAAAYTAATLVSYNSYPDNSTYPVTVASGGYVTILGDNAGPASLRLNFAAGNYTNLAGYVRTNSIYNSTMVGGVNGTLGSGGSLPTTWAYFTTVTGLSYQLTYGSIGGRAYIDFCASGTATAGYFNLNFDSGPTVVASGQTWTVAADVSVLSGSLANVSTVQMQINENTSVGVYVAGGAQTFTPTSTSTRYWYTRTLSGGVTVARGLPILTLNTSGGAIDVTFRIFAPQFEQTSYPSAFIPTTTAAVSVTTYASSNPADVGNLTYTRAGTAYAPDSAGNLIPFGDNQIRITDLGYWAEEARTNSTPNSTANNGAVPGTPGTLPTGWVVDYNPSGLSTQVVGTGTEGGVPYLDWRVFGTLSAFGQINLSTTNSTTIVAAQGQTWTASSYVRAVAGSVANLSSVQQVVIENTAVGTYLLSSSSLYAISSIFTPTIVTQNRLIHSRTLTSATVARIINTLVLSSTPGGAVDITLRIAAPQMELGANASTYIPTTSAAATRAADVGYYTIPSLSTAYTLAAVGSSSSVSGLFPQLAQLDSGSDANRAMIFGNVSASTTIGSGRVDAGGVAQSDAGAGAAFTNRASFGVVLSVQASRMARSTNGSAVVAGSGTVPTVNALRLGTNAPGGLNLNGPLSKVAYWSSSALSDREIKLISALPGIF